MPSQRQMRTLLVGVVIGVVFVLFYTSHLRSAESKDGRTIQDFYHKTVQGLENMKPGAPGALGNNNLKDKDHDGDIDADDEQLSRDMAARLKAAEEEAKDLANKKAPLKPDPPSEVVGMGNSAAHQDAAENRDAQAPKPAQQAVVEDNDPDVKRAVEAELNGILRRSPVIIFSKTYCPFSKRAKGLLLDKYSIEPAPHIVELDEHPLGKQLQAYLGEKTGRKTVPNVLVNSVSIGGSDDLAELEKNNKLVDKFIQFGKSRVTMTKRLAQ